MTNISQWNIVKQKKATLETISKHVRSQKFKSWSLKFKFYSDVKPIP